NAPQVAVADLNAVAAPDHVPIAKVEPAKSVEPPPPPAPSVPLVPLTPAAPPTPTAAPPAQIDAANIRRVKKATTFLRVTAGDGVQMSGTGFFAIEPGIVFTNAHVVDMLDSNSPPPRSIDVVLNSGEPDEKVLRGTIVGVDRDHDLAILKASGAPGDWPEMLAVDFAANLIELQDVYIFGFPFGANLGKNITVSKSSISSLRRDESGQLHEVQVNGGMNPGNSGGPVVDSRGVVVGVAVAIIRGTQINFAVPAERVLELGVGRVLESRLQDPYLAGDAIRLPFEVTCLDPLQRVRKVEVEVWTGPVGPNRAGGTKSPVAVAGDGQHSRLAMTYVAAKATADLTLPPAKAGSVVWVQPILTDADGKSSWGTARSASLSDFSPLTRQPATIRLDFAKAPERTLVLKNHVRVELKKRDLVTEDLEAKILELAKVGADGGQTELWIGAMKRVTDIDGKKKTSDPKIIARLNAHAIGWVFHPEGRSKVRSNVNLNPRLNPLVRLEMEDLLNAVCNGLESTFVPVGPAEMKPGGTWPARVPMMIMTQGKAEVADLQLVCTYEGTRTVDNATMAFVRATGQIVPRKSKNSSFLRGKVDGRIHYDLAGGYIGEAKMRLTSDLALLTGNVAKLVIDTELKRTPGNTFNIVVPSRPDSKTTPTPKTKTPRSTPQPDAGAVTLGDLVFEDTKLSGKDLLPSLIWAADGKSFYTVELSGTVRRIGSADLVEQKKAELGGPCSWMTMSAEGL
ncbi:MAG TPA: serine protease, partial [Gemmataceae bacterium]|nr:serine protease [Gemmataceae bacterium]